MRRVLIAISVSVVVVSVITATFLVIRHRNSSSVTQLVQNSPKASASSLPVSEYISAALVSSTQHKTDRADFLVSLAKKQSDISTVVLVGTASAEAKTIVEVSGVKTGIDSLANTVVTRNEDLKNNVLDEVAAETLAAFQHASQAHVLLSSSITSLQVTSVVNALKTDCAHCLIIAFSNLSQGLPASVADLHDTVTERVLDNVDTAAIWNRPEFESPPVVAFLMEWASVQNTLSFQQISRTNSGEPVTDPDATTTSQLLGYYQAGDKTVPKNSVNFLIGGDMMFGRGVQYIYWPTGMNSTVANLGERLFWGTDAGIINLEGPVSKTHVPDTPFQQDLVFNFSPESVGALSFMHVNVASQANNHSANHGAAGLQSTRDLLTAANINPLGGPTDADVDRTVDIKGQNITLHIIGVHCLETQPSLADLIKKLKATANDRVLVFPHCGVEYQPKHSSTQQTLYRSWIDQGADVVIGAHPHVIEDAEMYKGKPIIYSLGNLLFDQSFSVPTQQGMLIGGQFTDDTLTIFGLPVQLSRYRPQLMTGVTKTSLLDSLYAPLAAEKTDSPAGTVLTFSLK